MASWGLAFEYGKNAYTDMLKKQEELDRYLAERDLWRARLTEEEEAQTMNTYVNREVRAAQKAITENKKGIEAGDIDSYLRAKNALASGTGYTWVKLDGSKIGIRTPDGSINKDTIRDLSSDEWKNPAARIAELEKSAKTIMDMASQYRKDVEKNNKDAWEREKFYAEDDRLRDIAEGNWRNNLAVARIGAEAKALGLTGGSKDKSGVHVDEKHVAAANNYAARAVLGVNVSVKADDNNTMRFYDATTGAEIPVNDKQRQDINKGAQWILTHANNTAATHKVDIDVALGNSAIALQNNITSVQQGNLAKKAKIEEQAKRVSEMFAAPNKAESKGGLLASIYNPNYGLEVVGKISNRTPFGMGMPGTMAGDEWNSAPIQYDKDVLGNTYMD